MDTKYIVNKLLSRKTKDYTYLAAFFLLFSFFLFFVIRPNLLSVFNANTKIEELKKIDAVYGEQIIKVIDLQTSFENNRSAFSLLSDAIARSPQVNKILSDINTLIDKHELTVDRVNIGEINLKEAKLADQLKAVTITVETGGTFQNLISFIEDLSKQRRLKVIKSFSMGRDDKGSTDSAALKVRFDIEGYFL